MCGARSRLPATPGLLPLHFPALSPSCRRKCSGPRDDPPHPSYSNSLDSLPAAFASIHPCRRLSLGHICSLFLHRVHRLWCTVRLVYHPSHLAALLVLACLGLSSPCSPSLSLSPSRFLSLSLSQLYFIASFSLYMVSLIYALHSPSNLPLSSFSATADFTVLKVSAHRTPVTSHGAKI